jgi:FeS assembly SUF system regulator
MIRLSKLADYGTVAMSYMALRPEEVHTAPEIAAAIRLAVPTVSKLLKLMGRKGLLVSLRGSRGGYRLAHRPDRITVVQVVEAVDGPFSVTECTDASCRCSLEPDCPIQWNWRGINGKLRNVLDGVTIADLTRQGSGGRAAALRSPATEAAF